MLHTRQFIIKHWSKMHDLLNILKESNAIELLIVYVSFLLDNILLTVVVPIIPDYLFSHDANVSSKDALLLRPESLSPLQRKFQALENDNGPLGTLLASKAFVQLIFTPVVGYLISTFGCNLPLLLGSCNMLVAALLFAYGHSYGVLILARALHGSSSAAIAVSGMCLLATSVPKDLRFKVMPIAFGGIALGVLIGYPLGGAAYQYLGKSTPFLLIALIICLSIGLQLTCFDQHQNHIASKVDVMEWVYLLKDIKIFIVAGALCIGTSAMAVLEPCVPMWLLARMVPPPTRWQLGAVFIPDSVGYFIGSHFTGLLPVLPWRIAITAMLISGLSCCAIPLASSIDQLSFPHFGLGLGVGALDAALVPLLASLVDTKGGRHYGPVYSLQQASVSLAYCVGPFAGGQVIHSIGFPWLMRLVGFLNIMYCPFLLELEELPESMEPLLEIDKSLPSYSTLDNTPSTNNEWN